MRPLPRECEAAEPSFSHDVIRPTAFTVHTLPNLVLFDKVNVLLACELTALIRTKDLWLWHFKCFLKGIDNHSAIKCIIDFPADNTAAIPVDYGSQIQENRV